MPRKPVVAVMGDTPGDLVVFCDDGTVWTYDHRDGIWVDLAPIPGTPAHPDTPKPQRPKVKVGR